MMVTIDVSRVLQTVGIWLLAVVVTMGVAYVGAKTKRWSGAWLGLLLALAVVGAATLLQMVL